MSNLEQARDDAATVKVLEAEIERLRGLLEEATNFLERAARTARDEPWPDHYDDAPPAWAEDEYGGASRCGYCEAWLTVVRPGKSQCDCCSDGQDFGALARHTLTKIGEPR